MEKSELVRKYELVVVVDAKLAKEAKDAVRKEVTDEINKHGGKVINSRVWLEKQKFTFQIKKCTEGTYYLINCEGKGEVVEKIQSGLRLNEKILRFVFVKIEPRAAAEPARAA